MEVSEVGVPPNHLFSIGIFHEITKINQPALDWIPHAYGNIGNPRDFGMAFPYWKNHGDLGILHGYRNHAKPHGLTIMNGLIQLLTTAHMG